VDIEMPSSAAMSFVDAPSARPIRLLRDPLLRDRRTQHVAEQRAPSSPKPPTASGDLARIIVETKVDLGEVER
jgi:hypothetical protein